MDTTLPPRDDAGGARARAARDLAVVEAKVDAARTLLARLLQDVVVAESRLSNSDAAKLLDANEQLVVSALHHQAAAATAAQALNDATRSAELDALTQLPNRVLLLDRFAQAIANAKRHGTRLALLFLDLNNFKQINDTLGHAFGDEVLKVVARRLASAVRDADTVSRHGGDEFLILLNGVSQPSDAALIAGKLMSALGAPSRLGAHVLRLTASIGISVYPDDGEEVDALVDLADAAMYRAKRHGLRSYAFHGEAAEEQGGAGPAPVALQSPLTRHEQALAEHERRHTELREANEQLVLATLDANDLRAAAERAHRRQAEFMTLVAQELGHPLTPIRLATAMLGRVRAEEPLLPRAQSIIEQQVQNMERLVGAVQQASSAHVATLDLRRQPVDMAHVAEAAVAAGRPAMDMRLQTFTLHLPAGPTPVSGDPARLVQIVSNLLDNASKYTPDRGEIGLSLALDAERASVVLAVSDNGIGISAQALPTIFEPFVQDIHAIGFNGVGLGIGLSVVRALVEAHGGTVTASSPGKGMGSRFVVTLARAGGGSMSDAERPAGA